MHAYELVQDTAKASSKRSLGFDMLRTKSYITVTEVCSCRSTSVFVLSTVARKQLLIIRETRDVFL